MNKTFYIKNMVCDRCIKVLQEELQQIPVEILDIKLGEVQLNLEANDETKVIEIVQKNGFRIINQDSIKLVEAVKIILIKLLNNLPVVLQNKLSDHIASELGKPYYKVSKTFSKTTKITIEKYFIKLKIEKVKELLQNQTYNFTDISQLLGYSNVNHLSRQFKAETGLNLSEYKAEKTNSRNPLDKII